MSVRRHGTLGTRHGHGHRLVGPANIASDQHAAHGTGHATPERTLSSARRKGQDGIRRSATLKATGQKKGLDLVKQGIFQIHPAVDGPQATSSKPGGRGGIGGESNALPGKTGEAGTKTETPIDLDIVFVPGLGADPEGSWQSEDTGFNWLKDKNGITRDFPNARVLLYKFASAWLGSMKVQQDLRNLAKTLLDGLKFKRQDVGSRPTVFIGHSMGGLIVAKAVCLALACKDEYPNMFEDITGCVFFGVPFEGAPAASRANMLAYIGQKVGKAEKSKLLTLMEPKNDALMEMKDEFMRAVGKLDGSRIQLYCFYEEFLTTSPTSLVHVTRDSAVLLGTDSTGLAANHRDLVRFDSSKDERYALVRGPIKTLIKDAHRIVRSRRHATRGVDQDMVKKVLETLDGAQVNRKRKLIRKSTAPSSWVSDESQYINWLCKFDTHHDGGSSVVPKHGDCLWIRGPDGRGKTSATLAALDGIESMQKENASVYLAYFFCDHASDYDKAEELVKSLVRQLIQQNNDLAPHARFLLRKKGSDSKGQAQLTVENMWQVLQDILADEYLAHQRIYFVLNNLEALPDDADSTHTFLNLVNMEIKQMNNGRKSTVRWMVTSSYSVGQGVRSDAIRVIDLEDEKYSDQVQRELRRHAYDKVSKFIQRRRYSKALAYYASSLIGRRAQNTQWIDITIVQLEQLSQDEDDLRIRMHLEIMPQQLDRLLTMAWNNVFDQAGTDRNGIKAILRVLVLTFEDPTQDELGLLTDLYTTEHKRQRLCELVNQCKPLVKVTSKWSYGMESMRIGFEQAVVKNHLLENAHELLGLSDEDIKLHHGVLAFRAFSHIMEKFSMLNVVDDDAAYLNKQQQSGQSDINEHGYEYNVQFEEDEEQNRDEDEDESETDEDSEEDEDEGGSETEQDSDEDEDDESESDSQSPVRKSQETIEAEVLRDQVRALPYAVKHWMSHASQATEIAEHLVAEREFWVEHSDIRRRWLIEHTRLVGPNDSFKYTDLSTLTGLHVAGGIGFRHLIEALMKTENKDEINKRDSWQNTPLHFAAHFGRADLVEELYNRGAYIDDGIDECVETPLAMAAEEGEVRVMAKLLQYGANPNALSREYGGVINAAISSGNIEAVELLVAKNVSLASQEEKVREKIEAMEAEAAARQQSEANFDEAYSYDGSSREEEGDESESEASSSEWSESEDDEIELVRSPLALAALRSDLTMFNFLIERYADQLLMTEFNTAFIKAAKHGRMEAFLRLYRDYQHPRNIIEEALNAACKGRQWDIIPLLLRKYPGLDYNTAFLNTCRGYDTEQEIQTLQTLWEYSNNSISDETLNKSLYLATDYEAKKTVKELLALGASPSATGNKYGNALTASAYDGTLPILEVLMEHGAEVNSPDGWALQAAAGEGHVEIVQLLLRKGANVDALTRHDNMPHGTALQAAVEAGNEEIVIQLLQYGADPDKGPLPDPETGYKTCPLIAAIEGGWRDILERLILAKASLQVVGGLYTSGPIGCAVNVLPLQSMMLLLSSGADINVPDEDGDTALILAAWGRDAETVNFLLDHGADVLHRNNRGLNALQLANGNDDLVIRTAIVEHVSLLMAGMSDAVEAGDRSVTAIVRNVQQKSQGLEYGGEPSTANNKPEEAGSNEEVRVDAAAGTNVPDTKEQEPPTTTISGTSTSSSTSTLPVNEEDTKGQPQWQQEKVYIPWNPERATSSVMTGDTLVSTETISVSDGYYGSFQPAGPASGPTSGFDPRASISSMRTDSSVAASISRASVSTPPAASPPISSPRFQPPLSSPQFHQQQQQQQQHYPQPPQRQNMPPRYLSYQTQHPQRAVVGAESYQNPMESPPPPPVPGTPYRRTNSNTMYQTPRQSPPVQGDRRLRDSGSVSYFSQQGPN